MNIPIRSGWFRRRRKILLFMDLTSTCDIHCIHCFREIFRPKPYRIGPKRLRILKEDVFPYVKRLSLSETGESLYVRAMPDALKAAKDGGIPTVHIQSNGTHLSESVSLALLQGGLDILGVSLDAATPKTFETIRAGADWRTVENNVRTLLETRKFLRNRNMTVILNFSLMKQNAGEAKDFLKLAKEWGVDSVSYTHLFIEKPEMKEWSLMYDREFSNHLHRELRTESERLGIPALIPNDLQKPILAFDGILKKDPVYHGHCAAAHQDWMLIRVNGDCHPCFNLHDRPPIGYVFEQPFVEIWMGERNQRFRRRAIKEGVVDGCDGCKFFTHCERNDHEITYLAKRLTTAGVAGNEW